MATYYISPSGSNVPAGGTLGAPWQTLAYACGRVSGVGDIIHVNAGTYIESNLCILAPGVSIEGVGVTSIIKSHLANTDGSNDGLIQLSSGTQNTPGNQSISNLKLDGDNLQGGGAIYVYRRGNVSIHDCTIVNFNYCGVTFHNELSWVSPGTFATGNSLYNNIITNCHGSAGGGNVRLTSQETFSMYGNTIDGRTRPMQNSCTLSNCKATTIYNNTFYTLDTRNGSWNFSFEVWDTWGGLEFHHNNFLGGGTLDLGGHYTYKGEYAFGVSVHHNNFTLSSRQPYNDDEVLAITSESWQRLEDVYIYNNRITNFGSGIQVTFGAQAGGVGQNFYIYNNIFEGMGYSDRGTYIIGFNDQNITVASFTNVNIINNVIISGANPAIGIRYDVMGTNTTVNIKNNIISGGFNPAVRFALADYGGSLSGLAVTNNIFYQCGSSFSWIGIGSQGTLTPLSTGNPNFVSATDFHLNTGSVAIGYGTTVASVTTDYAGNPYATPRSVGVYEYALGGPSIPTVTTTSVTNILTTSASSGGTISSDGGASVTARGVCWATTSNPTIANSKTTDSTGTGTFTSSITGLTQSTIYHARAYATNSAGTAYGADIQFTTTTPVVIPTLTTASITSITPTTFVSGGTITNTGGGTITARGICWRTSTLPTTADAHTSDGSGSGTWTSNGTGIVQNIVYYVRAYATNSAGTGYGNEIQFQSNATAPTVTTVTVTSIAATTAVSGSTIVQDGGNSITVRGVCWATTNNPTIANSVTIDAIGAYPNTVAATLTGLLPSTTYYVRAYATNTIGTAYGSSLSFTTIAAIPTLNITSFTNITSTTVSTGGNTLNAMGAAITGKGVCWSTTTTPTIASSHTTDGSGTSNYTSSISGLTAGTLYYVRAYATNSVGTGYSSQLTFTTSPAVTYLSVIKAQVKKWMCFPSDQFIVNISSMSSDGLGILRFASSIPITVTVNNNGFFSYDVFGANPFQSFESNIGDNLIMLGCTSGDATITFNEAPSITSLGTTDADYFPESPFYQQSTEAVSPLMTINNLNLPNLELCNLIDWFGNLSIGSITMSDIPKSVKYLFIDNIYGTTSNTPTSLISLYMGMGTNFTGDIQYLPATLDYIYLQMCPIYGNISRLSNCRNINIYTTYNTDIIYGDLSTLSKSLKSFILFNGAQSSSNTLTGNLIDIASTIENFYIYCPYVSSPIAGSLSNLSSTVITSLTLYTPDLIINGNLSSLPASLTQITIGGLNTITGNLSSLKTGLTDLSILGNNTIYGLIESISNNLRYIYISGNNTISGSLTNVSSSTSLLYFNITGLNTITGNVSKLHNCSTINILGNNTINGYTTTTWTSYYMYFVQIVPIGSGGLNSSEVDQLLIDLSTKTWNGPYLGVNQSNIYLMGTCSPRTSTSDSAVATLQSKYVTVVTH